MPPASMHNKGSPLLTTHSSSTLKTLASEYLAVVDAACASKLIKVKVKEREKDLKGYLNVNKNNQVHSMSSSYCLQNQPSIQHTAL